MNESLTRLDFWVNYPFKSSWRTQVLRGWIFGWTNPSRAAQKHRTCWLPSYQSSL